MMKIAIILGSKSDLSVFEAAEKYLGFFQLEYEMKVMSAHRDPAAVSSFARSAREKGYSVIIAAAGMAAHLPGVIAAHTTLPVIGVPLSGSALNGVDALYSIVQMPKGIPVATMGIGKAGMINAVILAAEILSLQSIEVQRKLEQFRERGSVL